jgi:membrane fusion protein (multidrug efflux system)
MEDEIAHRREVALGLRLPGRVHVVEGLEPGEMVITAGHQRVTDGAEVRIAEDAATTE